MDSRDPLRAARERVRLLEQQMEIARSDLQRLEQASAQSYRRAARTASVAIDKVAGKGVDLPSLNTLFLAVPVSFKGRVIQQIGRVTRGGDADTPDAIVHDFRDGAVPSLERMHNRRRRAMLKEGFTVSDEAG